MKYDELPTRGKVTCDGEETRKCVCGGRCYVFYDEDRQYHVECENCGTVVSFKSSSLDMAIKKGLNKIYEQELIENFAENSAEGMEVGEDYKYPLSRKEMIYERLYCVCYSNDSHRHII